MRISQADFRTVQIDKGSVSCRVRYSLYQDGEFRYPESITCRGETVVAYFLTSTIRDYIAETAHGFAIDRHWRIAPEGSFSLNFYLEFPADSETAYLFPGLKSSASVPDSGYLAPGDRTAYANGLYLFGEPESVLIFSDPARCPEETGSIELRHGQSEDDQGRIRTEVRVPAAATAGSKKKTRKGTAGSLLFESRGGFEYNLRLNVVIAAKDQILRRGVTAVLERNTSRVHPAPRLPGAQPATFIEAGTLDCLKMFLLDRGPVCGLSETKTGKKISSVAGCTLALIQLRYLSEDQDAVELSKRLADFSLKGQHPRGLFFPDYWTDRQSWLPQDSDAAIPLGESATVALMLLRIAVELQALGLHASAYLHAATHMADSLLRSNRDMDELSGLLYPDSLLPAGTAGGSPVLVQFLLELHAATGHDVYRKAASRLKSRVFSSQAFPAQADLERCLLQAHAAASLQESGHPVKALHCHFDALLPWLYLNRPGRNSTFSPFGGLRPSLGHTALVFRGFEVSYALLKLDSLMKKSARLGELNLLVSQLLSFTLQKPMGTSFYDPLHSDRTPFGPVNAKIWMRELYYLTRLIEEFPEAIG
jgi:hypothetical protein